MSGIILVIAGMIGFLGLCIWDLARNRKNREDDERGRQKVSEVSNEGGVTRIWITK